MFDNPEHFNWLYKTANGWKKMGMTQAQWEVYAINTAAEVPDSVIAVAISTGNLKWLSKIVWDN